jgi:hypothetical protein
MAGDPWDVVTDTELLWEEYEHRWQLHSSPTDSELVVQSVDFLKAPWPVSDVNTAAWESFASCTDGADCWAVGDIGEGYWAVRPRLTVGDGVFVFLQNAPRANGFAIQQVQFQGYATDDLTTNFWQNCAGVQQNFVTGDCIFPGRNFHEGYDHPTIPEDVSEKHDQVYVVITINPAIPAGKVGSVFIRVFDPDHYMPGAPVDNTAPFSDGADPNDFTAGSNNPDDNVEGGVGDAASIGMTPGQLEVTFEGGAPNGEDKIKYEVLTIQFAQPGNNFIVAASPNENFLNSVHFRSDGVTLERAGVALSPMHQTRILTVFRKLWVEVDTMVWADLTKFADGPFNGQVACGGGAPNHALCDDPWRDTQFYNVNLTVLANLLAPALVFVEQLSGGDNSDLLPFKHNAPPGGAANFGNTVRDVASEEFYWVTHTVVGYEQAPDQDLDGELGFTLGWGYIRNGDGPNFVFLETIRDVVAAGAVTVQGHPNPVPVTVAQAILENRVVAHETLHRFLGWHGTKGADDGIMAIAPTLSAAPLNITAYQIRLIQQRKYPK